MKAKIRTRFFFPLLLTSLLALQAGQAPAFSYSSKDLFPLPPALEDAVRFWIRVYGEYDCNEFALHDMERMGVVYEVVRIDSLDPARPDQELCQAEKDLLGEKKDRHRKVLAELASPETDFTILNGEKKRLFDLFGGARDPEVYRGAASSIRHQRGQKTRFLQGLRLSGRYEALIRQILGNYGVPLELAVLPHVESCFNYRAYSTAGAAGIWQFTRPTGRLFLQINYEIDERLDPLLSTEAAAKLLKHNHQELGSWPLAITAYNHGLQGMKRARQKLQTSDIGEIAIRYRSRYFGFASRNFYAEFLAALHVVENHGQYFGEVSRDPPFRFQEFELPHYAKIHTLAGYLNIGVDELAELNPALRESILQGDRYLPRGYRLRMPANVDSGVLIARVPSSEWLPSQKKDEWYRVRRGDNLARIAVQHGTTVPTLVALNDIRNSHQIRAGDVIRLPGSRPPEKSPKGPPESGQAATERAAGSDSALAGETIEEPSERTGRSFPATASAETDQREETPSAERTAGPESGRSSLGLEVELVGNSRPLAGHIRIEPEETLGHYADWLKVSVGRIRKWNRLSNRARIRSGQRIRLVFEKITPEQFISARLEYHRGVEEDFFNNYQVLGTFPHRLKEGENVWHLCSAVYNLPYWLIKRYNADIDSRPVKPGDVIQIPEVAVSGEASRPS